MNEETLVTLVQEGDKDAFGELIDLHVRRLRSFVALNVPVAHLIDEIAHEAFVYAYENISRFTAGTSFSAWLKGIARNLIRREVQRYSRKQVNLMKYSERCLVEVANAKMDGNEWSEMKYLESCMKRLSKGSLGLVEKKYTLDLSTKEISVGIQKSLAWVRTTLYRIRQELKHCIEKRIAKEEA